MISSVRSLTPVDLLTVPAISIVKTKDEEDADLSRDDKEKMSSSILMNLRHEVQVDQALQTKET
jgi:hypothetical protein